MKGIENYGQQENVIIILWIMPIIQNQEGTQIEYKIEVSLLGAGGVEG